MTDYLFYIGDDFVYDELQKYRHVAERDISVIYQCKSLHVFFPPPVFLLFNPQLVLLHSVHLRVAENTSETLYKKWSSKRSTFCITLSVTRRLESEGGVSGESNLGLNIRKDDTNLSLQRQQHS